MRRTAVMLCGLCGLCGLAPPAQAQTTQTTVGVFGGGANVVSSTLVNARLSGSVVVTFHGDPAAGCVSRGLCSYNGVIVWRPSGGQPFPSELAIEKLRRHGRTSYAANLFVYGPAGPGGPVSAVAHRAVSGGPAASCADASTQGGNLAVDVRGGNLLLGLLSAHSSILSTRCAGPLDGDVAPVLPRRTLAISAALQGHRRVDLGGSSSFAAGGFAGTVRSTIVVSLGGSQTNPPGGGPQSGGPGSRVRVVTVPLTLVRTSGTITARVLGAANPDVCLLLDSCGLTGSVSLRPRPVAVHGGLTAYGPARRPYRDYLAALGLSRRGRAAGIVVIGSFAWNTGGSITTAVNQTGTCRDSTTLGSGTVSLQRQRNQLEAYYALGAPGSGRLRCPGPELSGGVGGAPAALVSGTIPIRAFAGRRFSISLRTGATVAEAGYRGRMGGSLSLTFKRGAPTRTVFSNG